jgi:hypothetical protein
MNRDTDRDFGREMDTDPAETYTDGSDNPRKFIRRGMIPRSDLFKEE